MPEVVSYSIFERSDAVALVDFWFTLRRKNDREDAEFKGEGHSLGHGKFIRDIVMTPMTWHDLTR